MKNNRRLIVVSILFFCSFQLFPQTIKLNNTSLEASNVSMSFERLTGKPVVRIVMDETIKTPDAPTFAILKGTVIKDGTIEVMVLSRLLSNAAATARGFIGIAFRINDSASKFECIYIRPTNGRADDQLRRNHSIQYFSFPDFNFDRLRKEASGVYESYADMGLNEWIKLKIEVKGNQAKLFINDTKQPSLIVNDLKHGETSGRVGLWVDTGTEGFFTGLRIHND